jgi:endonuclease YncB( thermonuclease family)
MKFVFCSKKVKMNHSESLQTYTLPKKAPVFCPAPCDQKIPVKCVDVYDGDTVKLAFHLFNDPTMQVVVFSCRLIGINACEMKSSISHEKAKAVACRDYLRSLCLGQCIYAKFHNDVKEKFGRQLVELFIDKDDIQSVNKLLVEKDYDSRFMDE